MLHATDPLPARPRRIVVAGVSGVGKTTLSARIAEVVGIPHVEIDALFHGRDWTPRPEFLDDVRAFVARDEWVTEWQYGDARPLLTARADLLVWLDLPFATVTLPRVVARTVRRRMTRQQLWNGNVEPPFHTFFTDPNTSCAGRSRRATSTATGSRPCAPTCRWCACAARETSSGGWTGL